MARITKAEKELRVTQVADLLLKGVKRAQILRYASEKGWGVTDRQIESYISDATAKIKESAEIDRDYEIAVTKERYENLYTKNIVKGDLREARNVLKDNAALFGLEAPKKTDITSGGEKLEGATNEQIDRAISTLADAIGESVSGKSAERDSSMDAAK